MYFLLQNLYHIRFFTKRLIIKLRKSVIIIQLMTARTQDGWPFNYTCKYFRIKLKLKCHLIPVKSFSCITHYLINQYATCTCNVLCANLYVKLQLPYLRNSTDSLKTEYSYITMAKTIHRVCETINEGQIKTPIMRYSSTTLPSG